jgi:hypothetical protein
MPALPHSMAGDSLRDPESGEAAGAAETILAKPMATRKLEYGNFIMTDAPWNQKLSGLAIWLEKNNKRNDELFAQDYYWNAGGLWTGRATSFYTCSSSRLVSLWFLDQLCPRTLHRNCQPIMCCHTPSPPIRDVRWSGW